VPPPLYRVLRARDDVDADGCGVRRLLAVEYLHDGRPRVVDGVTRKAVHRGASAVTEQASQRCLLLFRKFVVRQLPRDQLRVDVLVERPFPGFGMVQQRHRRNRLADGSRLEKRLDSGRLRTSRLPHAVGLGPHDCVVVEHRHADGRNVEQLHPFLDGHFDRRLVFDLRRRKMLDACNPRRV